MGLQANPSETGKMAIYSLNHRPIGKSTQERPNTASAHVGYIARRKARGTLFGARMPTTKAKAMEWFAAQESGDRKNARVADKLMLALPRELDDEQRKQLVARFAEEVTKGRAPWIAAIHQQGKDEKNPHCHLILRDRDFETGKRVFESSEKGSTIRLREIWEKVANEALAENGFDQKIDRRTLKEQGLDREPTVHEGPKAQQMDRRKAPFRSVARLVRNGIAARQRTRTIDYSRIDNGRSRPQFNRAVRQVAPEAEQELWSTYDRHNQQEELSKLKSIHNPSPEPEDLREVRRKWLKTKTLGLDSSTEHEHEYQP